MPCRKSELVDGFLETDTVDELNTKAQAVKDGLACSKQVREGLVKAVSHLKSHIANKIRAAIRKQQNENLAKLKEE